MGEVTEKIYCCDKGDKGYSFQIEDINITKLSDKQEEEERKLAEQYGMPYKESGSIK